MTFFDELPKDIGGSSKNVIVLSSCFPTLVTKFSELLEKRILELVALPVLKISDPYIE